MAESMLSKLAQAVELSLAGDDDYAMETALVALETALGSPAGSPVSPKAARVILEALDAEFAAGRRAADGKVLDARRREKAALDSLEALKAAHAAEVEKLKAEINALNKALQEECE